MKRLLTIGVPCRPFLHPLLATCLVLSVGWPALAAEGPTSVVVVPPVVSGDEESRQAAAAMLSDRLAASLSAMANTEVVDRTQIDRVLRERATSDGDHGPIVSFNLILRVREDVRPIGPALVVELIDLSLGNVTGSWRLENWDGAVTDAQVEQAGAVVRQTIEAFRAATKRPVAVRLLGVGNPQRSVRLDPLAEHLLELMAATVEKTPQCSQVRHLEALTAKEESLFLYMGLSRLPGGRQFLPQADLQIEAELREVDSVGKTFKETPLELSWWVVRRGEARGKARVLRQTAGQWPALAGQFCQALAAELGDASPVALGDFATEMARRRQQAMAELAAAENEMASDPGTDGRMLDGRIPTVSGGLEVHPAYARMAAAAKLDPTYEQAAYLLASRSLTYRMIKRTDEARAWSIRQCLDYLERFPNHAKHRVSVLFIAITSARGLYLFDLDRGAPPLTPLKVETLDVLQSVLEHLPQKPLDMTTRRMISSGVGRLCSLRRLAEASRADRVAWLDRYIQRYEQLAGKDQIELVMPQLAMALGDGDLPAARTAAEVILSRPLPPLPAESLFYPKKVYALLEKMNDKAYLIRFRQWFEPQIDRIPNKYSERFARQWLAKRFPDASSSQQPSRTPPPSADELERRRMRRIRRWPEMAECLDPRDRAMRKLRPLIVHNGQLFLARGGGCNTSPPPKGELLRMRLDHKGRALGKPEPLPESPQAFGLAAVAASGTRIYFSLLGEGLYEFNTATDAWRTWGAADGLPTVRIRDIFPLNENEVLLSSRARDLRQHLVKLNVETGAVTLLRKGHGRAGGGFPDLNCTWRNGDRWLSLNGYGRVVDGLGGGVVDHFPIRPEYWGANYTLSSAAIGSRRWVVLNGLFEIDQRGKVIHSYYGKPVGRPEADVIPPFHFMNDLRGLQIFNAAEYLFMVKDHEVACYDPASDMWYGPFEASGYGFSCPVAAPGGIWIGTKDGPGFIDADRFIAEARARHLARKSAPSALTRKIRELEKGISEADK